MAGPGGDFKLEARNISTAAVVVNFNGGNRVLACLKALFSQDSAFSEVVLVDNGSIDGSLDRIRDSYPSVQILELGRNHGPSVARNAGLEFVTTDFVLLVDSDIYVAKQCLSYLVHAGLRYQATVVSPRIVLFPQSEIVHCDGAAPHFLGTLQLRHGFFHIEDASNQTTLVGACPSGCLLVHRVYVLDAGGFDDSYFFYFEDLELSIRLRALGHKLVCEPKALAYHDRGTGTPGLSFRGHGVYPLQRAYLTFRNRLTTIFIHYRFRTLMVLLPSLAAYELCCLIVALKRGWLNEYWKSWRWQLKNAPSVFQRRKRVQKRRKLGDKDILVGGDIPLAPGFNKSQMEVRVAALLSLLFDGYWRLARPWIA